MRALAFVVFAVRLAAQDAQLEHIRSVNLARAANLPNFVADEIAVRYRSTRVNPPQWRQVDTIESEIAVQGRGGFTRNHTLVDGKPWNKEGLPNGVGWGVLFGYELKALFDPKCHTAIKYSGETEIHGARALEYRFHAAAGSCFGAFSSKNGFLAPRRTADPARTGKFIVDDPGGNLISFEIDAIDIPKDFDLKSARAINTWDYVKIGDASYLLPVAFEFLTDSKKIGLWRVTVEYRNHRHFESASNLSFQ